MCEYRISAKYSRPIRTEKFKTELLYNKNRCVIFSDASIANLLIVFE